MAGAKTRVGNNMPQTRCGNVHANHAVYCTCILRMLWRSQRDGTTKSLFSDSHLLSSCGMWHPLTGGLPCPQFFSSLRSECRISLTSCPSNIEEWHVRDHYKCLGDDAIVSLEWGEIFVCAHSPLPPHAGKRSDGSTVLCSRTAAGWFVIFFPLNTCGGGWGPCLPSKAHQGPKILVGILC